MSATLESAQPRNVPSHHAADLGESQLTSDAQSVPALPSLGDGQGRNDAQSRSAVPVLDPGQAFTGAQKPRAGVDLDGRHAKPEVQTSSASVDLAARQSKRAHHEGTASGALLALAAAALSDIERTRIAMQNRMRAMRDDHGLGDTPEYARMEAMLHAIEAAEHTAELELKRALRKHPLGPWVKQTIGIGEKQGARLLAAVDDPAWNHAEDRPRHGPAEFWQYCGHGDPERSRRRKGQRVEFSPEAKMRTHLIAESCIKQMHSPYRAMYDAARTAWAERDTTDGHKHNHALRLVGKAVLKDLFLAACQFSSGIQSLSAGGEG